MVAAFSSLSACRGARCAQSQLVSYYNLGVLADNIPQ